MKPHRRLDLTGGPYSRIYGTMKTTIELPDAVVKRAKVLAAERRTTLRELVLQGLEHVLSEKRVSARQRAQSLFEEMDALPEFSARDRLDRSDAHAR